MSDDNSTNVCSSCGCTGIGNARNCMICRAVHNEKARRWRKKNPEKAKEANRRRYAKLTPEAKKRYQRASLKWGQERPHKRREYTFRSRYGIDILEYKAILEKQGGGCAICGGKPKTKGRFLPVDHDHKTGIIRGILCDKCNVTLGFLGDSLTGLRESFKRFEKYLLTLPE